MNKIPLLIALSWALIYPAVAADMIIYLNNGGSDTLDINCINTFYVADSSAGNIVRLTEPYNGAVNIALLPELRWRIIPDQQYELMVSENLDFTNLVIHVSGLMENSYRVADTLKTQTLYYWKVRTSNTTEWSAVWHFTTYTPVPPGQIRSFAVVNGESPNSLQLLYSPDDDIDEIIAFISYDGLSFTDTVRLALNSLDITGLAPDKICYIRLKGANSAGSGPVSEVLAGIPSSTAPKLLIVNGFDRNSTGNTYNFVRQHGTALNFCGYSFESATNEAITDGLISLSDYEIVDYILGEESTVDETFSDAEQDNVEQYLQNGGKLFVSGAEIAWDLDYKGNADDKAFCHNYLKIAYAADAPNNQSNTWYTVEPVTGTLFSNLPERSFDNGSHGTYNVDWPDVFNAINGSQGFIKFANYNTAGSYAGVLFDGLFPNGTNPGKIVITGFPFETIYPESNRNSFMSEVMRFFEYTSKITPEIVIPYKFALYQNYPNPFNNTTIIPFQLAQACNVKIRIYDLLGREVQQVAYKRFPAGYHRYSLTAEQLSSGEYIYTIEADEFRESKIFCIIK